MEYLFGKNRRSQNSAPSSPSTPPAAAYSPTPTSTPTTTPTPAPASPLPSPKPQSSPSTRSGSSRMSSGLDVEGRLEKMNIEEEYERRLRALSICLEEKAEENIRLAMSLEQKEDQFKKMNQQLENERNEKQEKGELAEEYQRRIQVLSTCLEDLAEENVKLLQKVKTTADSTDTSAVGLLPPVSQNSIVNLSLSPNSPGGGNGGSGNADAEKLMQHLKAEKEERRKAEALIATLQEDLDKRKMAGRNFEKQVRMLSTKLQKEEDRRRAYIEAIEEYEKKLVALEKDLRSSLQKEAERRREAEYHASQLKKKVAELQFLLEEKLAEDDEEEEEDDDSDEEKRS